MLCYKEIYSSKGIKDRFVELVNRLSKINIGDPSDQRLNGTCYQ